MKSFTHRILAAVAYGKGLPAKRLWNCLLVVAAFAGLAGLVALTDPPKSGAAGEPAKSVIVANTPLPVSGTVGISGTPNVNVSNTPLPVSGTVGISGTPNVNVSNMPTVRIDSLNNTVRIARDAENPARSPFFFSCARSIADGASTAFCNFSVPAGQRLVVENVNGEVFLPPGQKPLIRVDLITAAGVASGSDRIGAFFLVPSAFQGNFFSGSEDNYAVNQPTRVYADHNPSGTVDGQIQVFRTATTGAVIFAVNIVGYLITPTP